MARSVASTSGETAKVDWLWWGLIALLGWVAIPFGSNRPWAWSLAALWTALLLFGWAVDLFRGRRQLVWRSAMVVPLALLGLVLAWIVASIVPGVGPAHPIWQVASETLGRPLPGRMTLSVEATLVALMRLLSYVTVFWLAFQLCRHRDKALAMARWITGISVVLALYGLIGYFAGNSYILWFERWTGLNDVTSTFVNRNHYATFAAMGLLLAVGLVVNAFRAAWSVSDRSQRWLVRFIESFAGTPIRYALAALVIAMAWLQTHSRMGAVAGLAGLVILLILMWATGMVRRVTAIIVVAGVVLLLLFQVSGGGVWERIHADTGPDDRVGLFAIVGDQIESAPLTGSGYGTFAQSFPMYRDLRLPNKLIYQAAHNTYLEAASEIGIPAAVALTVIPLWCAALCLIGAFRRRKDRMPAMVAVASSAVVAVHSLADFSIQMPAVAMLYAAILGMGVAQSWSTAANSE